MKPRPCLTFSTCSWFIARSSRPSSQRTAGHWDAVHRGGLGAARARRRRRTATPGSNAGQQRRCRDARMPASGAGGGVVGEIETDYLVVGAGASGMAFVDSLVAAADADVVIVDRRH